MGWGLIINNVYLSRVTKPELDEVIDDAKRTLSSAKERLLMLAAATPQPQPTGHADEIVDWFNYIQREINEIFEDVQEHTIRKHLAEIAKDNPQDVTEG